MYYYRKSHTITYLRLSARPHKIITLNWRGSGIFDEHEPVHDRVSQLKSQDFVLLGGQFQGCIKRMTLCAAQIR